jgi:peptidyl-dipeptidase Dcp
VIDNKEDLAGLPQWLIEQGATDAKQRKMEGKWVYTLDNPSVLPFLQYSDKRALREKIFTARINRCNNNDAFDNKDIVAKIANLRAKKAELLGYKTFADYVLEERMAKTPNAVFDLLSNLNKTALSVAEHNAKTNFLPMLQKDEKGATLEGWDMYYYAEKYRKENYNFDEEQTRPYFEINKVRQGCFDVITKLYGLTFSERKDISVYAKDVTTYELKNEKGDHVGILYFDPYTRDSKVGGAWCNEYRGQYVKKTKEGEDRTTPIITVCFNFSKGSQSTHLTAEEASTIFHEMGHAVHQFLSDCTYPSTSGTNVPTDFVELPSQVFEHWFGEKEVLKMFATNDKGEVIPDALIDKISSVATFNQDFMLTELVAAAYLDMAYHSISSTDASDMTTLNCPLTHKKVKTLEFEANVMQTLGCIPQIPPRYRSTYFSHVFGDGGYSAGYYSYIWSEVLDADAFAAFQETGNIFDRATAERFKKEILSNGNKEEADVMYRNFRGRDAEAKYLLINRGLMPVENKENKK